MKPNESFRRATEAMAREDWDAAIASLRTACRLQPGNLVYRQSLRGCQYRKYADNKPSAKHFGDGLSVIRNRVAEAQLKWDWDACDEAAEDGLMLDPWNGELLANLGEACRERGYGEVAIDAYKRAILVDRDNAELRRTLEDLLDESGE